MIKVTKTAAEKPLTDITGVGKLHAGKRAAVLRGGLFLSIPSLPPAQGLGVRVGIINSSWAAPFAKPGPAAIR